MDFEAIALEAITFKQSGQRLSELKELLKHVYCLRAEYVVEIGSHSCGTLWAISQVVNDKCKLVAIDPDFQSKLNDSRITYLDMRSEDALEYINKSINFLHIDGDHWHDAPQRDWNLYFPLVAKGGLIAIHDIKSENSDAKRLWDSLADDEFLGYESYVGEDNQGAIGDEWGGYGFIWK